MKTRIVQKVFVFLLLTVGITFMLWRIASTKEPFVDMNSGIYDPNQFAAFASACSMTTLNNVPVFMCPSIDTANDLLFYQDTLVDTFRPNNRIFLSNAAAICYPSENQRTIQGGQSYYICYTRPPPVIFDPNSQSERYLDPVKDSDPTVFTLDATYPTTCSAFQSLTTMIIRNYSTTQINLNTVSTTIGTIQNAYSTLGTIYTAGCGTSQTGNKGAACSNLKNFFDGLQPNMVSNLQNTYSTIWLASSTMRGLYRNDVLVNFGGLNCVQPSISLPAGL